MKNVYFSSDKRYLQIVQSGSFQFKLTGIQFTLYMRSINLVTDYVPFVLYNYNYSVTAISNITPYVVMNIIGDKRLFFQLSDNIGIADTVSVNYFVYASNL